MKEIEQTITNVHGMMNEKLVGLVFDESESDDLMLVFDNHTINISGNFKLDIKER